MTTQTGKSRHTAKSGKSLKSRKTGKSGKSSGMDFKSGESESEYDDEYYDEEEENEYDQEEEVSMAFGTERDKTMTSKVAGRGQAGQSVARQTGMSGMRQTAKSSKSRKSRKSSKSRQSYASSLRSEKYKEVNDELRSLEAKTSLYKARKEYEQERGGGSRADKKNDSDSHSDFGFDDSSEEDPFKNEQIENVGPRSRK